MSGFDDDFIHTIDEDDNVQIAEGLSEEEVATNSKKRKISKKAAKKNVTSDDMDNSFTFNIEGGGSYKNNSMDWDFSTTREKLKAQTLVPRTNIDDIIAKKLKEQKMLKSEKKRKVADTEENDQAEAENGEGAEISDNDEDLAIDGFGGGVVEDEEESEHNAEDDSEADSSESESEEDDGDQNDNSDDDANGDEEEEENQFEIERKKAYFAPDSDQPEILYESFSAMNLSRPIQKGLASVGFVAPTAIQCKTIPVALLGKDICGGAVTGSGKTAAFVVPILERLLYRPRQTATTRVLILCPTRELAVQVHSVAVKLASFTDIQFCLCVGGLSVKSQELELKQKPDVVVATPGRLIDHVRNSPSFTLESCEILVMDEADRMLEDGFADELGEIVKACPKSRQTMLFSATMTDNVDQLIRMSLQRPVRLMIDPSNQAAAKLIQEFIRIRAHKEADRPAVLLALCKKTFKRKCIVFFRSKAAAHQMKIVFGLCGLSAAELHGNLSQEQRLEALEKFRDGEVDFLLATDLASRGLDIKGIEVVINFNMPQQFAQYLHRVGRTARAGRNGRSVTLIGEADRKLLKMAVKSSNKAQVKHRVVPAELIFKYKAKLESITEEVKDVMKQEKEDKVMRQAEMELKKSENLLQHADEIYSRPARTWFQSDKEKKKSKDVGKQAYKAMFKK
ncbi:P-loop containing nucleoside triphosphate hydrolase protein [Umbelopsis sp. PMI_123]|nr:P-loop containing nucleoside triphosphate hydrolase protein [Umbelopsis sp. PMI_123]